MRRVVVRMGEKFEVIATNTGGSDVHSDAGHCRGEPVPAWTESPLLH